MSQKVCPKSHHGKSNLKSCSSPWGDRIVLPAPQPQLTSRVRTHAHTMLKQGDAGLCKAVASHRSPPRHFATGVGGAARQVGWASSRMSDLKGLRSGSDDQHLTEESERERSACLGEQDGNSDCR